MTSYGGLGGIWRGRGRDLEDEFECAVARAFGKQMRTDDALCREIWSALSNVTWRHENGDEASYSFRAAGDLVAAIAGPHRGWLYWRVVEPALLWLRRALRIRRRFRRRGSYIDWYCSGPHGVVSDRVSDGMAAKGWTWTTEEMTL